MKKAFIEESFPVKEISEISAKEKNIRHGHISTLHIWWARRPLASSRATAYASLIPAVNDAVEWNKKINQIIELAKWENSLNLDIINSVRKDILNSNNGKPLRVIDPFSGGGSIPLECLRLGMEVHATEYNPVAVLILKCTLEYPQKYGTLNKIKEKGGLWDTEKEINPLLEDVKRWGEWVLKEAKNEIGKFYPSDEDGSIAVGYIWARTIPCQNPACNAEIPLMRQFWLAKKENKKVALKPYIKNGKVEFEIVGQGNPFPRDFEPEKGTVSRAVAHCLVCGGVVDDNTVRRLFQQGNSGQRMVAVVINSSNRQGKTYRLATEKDLEVFKKAEAYLVEKREKLKEEWGIDPVPDEEMPPKETLGFRVQRYGMLKWGDLFNSRQKLALITFSEKVRLAYKRMIEEGYDEDYPKAVVSYLGLGVNMLAAFCNSFARWENTSEAIKHLYSRQALPMIWDYAEVNPFSGSSGSWEAGWKFYLQVLSHITQIPPVDVEENEDG